MSKYIVRFYGWELGLQGFNLTKEQSDKLDDALSGDEYDSLDDIGMDIEKIIDIYIFEGNVFSMSKADFLEDRTIISIFDENENELSSFKLLEIGEVFDYIKDFDDEELVKYYPLLPEKGGVESVLLVEESNKGGLYEFHIESDEVPKPEDFAVTSGIVEMIDAEYDFIEDVYFKGKKLEIVEWLDNKGKGIFLHYNKLEDLD